MRKAVIVEDFLLIAEAWRSVLKSKGFEDIQICESSTELFTYLEGHAPEVIFMDVNIKGDMNGIDLTNEIVHKGLKVIILTTHSRREYVDAAFKAGAQAFITKNSTIEEISLAVDKVLSGERYLCKELSNQYNIVEF